MNPPQMSFGLSMLHKVCERKEERRIIAELYGFYTQTLTGVGAFFFFFCRWMVAAPVCQLFVVPRGASVD